MDKPDFCQECNSKDFEFADIDVVAKSSDIESSPTCAPLLPLSLSFQMTGWACQNCGALVYDSTKLAKKIMTAQSRQIAELN